MADSSPITSNFSFFHSIFKTLVLQTCKNQGFFGKGLILFSINTHFDASVTDSFENNVEKKEIACNKQFLIFPTMFSTQSDNCTPFVHIFDIIFSFAAELEEPEIGISGKGLISSHIYKGCPK